jgi:hypothetical protein
LHFRRVARFFAEKVQFFANTSPLWRLILIDERG